MSMVWNSRFFLVDLFMVHGRILLPLFLFSGVWYERYMEFIKHWKFFTICPCRYLLAGLSLCAAFHQWTWAHLLLKFPCQIVGHAQVHWLWMCPGSHLDGGSAILFEIHLPVHPMSCFCCSFSATRGLERALRTMAGCGGEVSPCSKPPKAN